jgi:hypothetical protein
MDVQHPSRNGHSQDEKAPNLHCLFTVSYGLERAQLEQLNFEIKMQASIDASSSVRSIEFFTD